MAHDCTVIVSSRATPAPRALFDALPGLHAFVRCAVDVRTIDMAAASANGVLVTRASVGFATSVAEWTLGAMIDLARGITSVDARLPRRRLAAEWRLGRELRGSHAWPRRLRRPSQRLASIGLLALGMRVMAHDPHRPHRRRGRARLRARRTCWRVPISWSASQRATAATENLIGARYLRPRCKPPHTSSTPRAATWSTSTRCCGALDSRAIAGCALDVGGELPTSAVIAARAPPEMHRDAACRRPDPRRHRPPGIRDRRPGRRDPRRARVRRCPQRGCTVAAPFQPCADPACGELPSFAGT